MSSVTLKKPSPRPPASILKCLRTRLGVNLGWRVNPEALVGEEREAAGMECRDLQKQRQAANEAVEQRRRVLLQDPEYLRLRGEAKQLEAAHARALGRYHGRRVTVGICSSVFFEVKAEGDSWEDALEKLEASKR